MGSADGHTDAPTNQSPSVSLVHPVSTATLESNNFCPPSQLIAEFLDEDIDGKTDFVVNILPIFQCSSQSPLLGKRSPKVMMSIEGQQMPVLLDSGAEVSVLPKSLMSQLVSRAVDTAQSRSVQSFGGAQVTLEGPRLLQIEICGVKLVHPFYSLDSFTPVVAGFDLIVAAQLVVDSVKRCAWSYFTTPQSVRFAPYAVKSISKSKTNSILPLVDPTPSAHSCINPVDSPSGIHLHENAGTHPVYESHHSPSVSLDTHVHDGSTVSAHVNAASLTGTVPIESTSDLQAVTLPENVRLLYDTTINQAHLSSSVTTGLHELLCKHADTFATSSSDLGFCHVILHDIDTGDALPIKQPPRRPPLAARGEEDRILDEMLQTGVIEPSKSPWASPVCLVKKNRRELSFLCRFSACECR